MNDRRRFLQVLSAAVVVVGAGVPLACGSSSDSQDALQPSGLLKAGKAKDVPLNSLVGVADQPVALGRDSGGLYALTTVCTHAGCNIKEGGNISASGLSCGCHGSQFDANGAVLKGPASVALRHFKVIVEADGSVAIDTGQVVAASERTPV